MQRLCSLSDVPDGEGHIVEHGGRRIALFRIGDTVYALANACPHKGGPLGEGKISVERGEIVCPWHRFRFVLETGICATYAKLGTRKYSVTVQDDLIYLNDLND